MAEIIKKVRLKDVQTGAYLYPETGISVPTKVSDLTNDSGFITASAVKDATLTVQKNGTAVGTFSANASTNKTINITVPTKASDLAALPDSTKYAASMTLSIDSDTYVITAQLKDQDGANLGTAQTIDLPLESVVVSGSYDNANKKIVLTLESGSTIDVPVGDLIAGLQTEITATNKLSADLIKDGTTNKVVTASEKTAWNNKQAAIADLATIRSNASAGKTASDTIATYGDIVTHDASEFQASGNYAAETHTHKKADITDFPTIPSKTSDLTNDSGFITSVPVASSTVSGTVKVGSGLSINNGVLSADAQKIDVDSALSSTSTNPVQNKVINSALAGKQDTISDLDTIRAGASKGATALQAVPAEYITETELEAKGYLTQHQDISGKQDKITSTNKLSADLVADGTTNKVVTATEKAAWNGKQDAIADLTTIRSGASAGATAVQPDDLATVATSGSYADLTNKPTIPTVNNATITIQKNGTKVDSFTANQASAKTINITVPTTAADVSALPASTKYGYAFDLSIDPDTYIISLTMKDQDGSAIGTAQTIDLPLESVVVNGSYDNTNKKIVLTLQSGSTVDVPVGDLIAGLQTQITSTNKLSADLIADGTTNKVVTATEKSTWNGKQAAISDLATIRSGAGKGATAVQPGDLATVATSGSYADLTNKPTIPTVDSALSSTSTNAIQNKVVNDALAGKANATHTHASDDITGLATVATSGSYTDLTNKPTIPAAVTETTVSGWGFTKNAGTVTSVKINGTSKTPASGVVDLGTVITAHQDISGKQDVISDLATIRSGAGKGATAVQPGDLATVATSGSYTDLTNKPTIPTVTDTYSATSTSAMSGKAVASAISNKMDKVTLATVATSGSYNDLTNKPTIPAAVTETTVSGWGFTKNAGTITGIKMNGASKGTSGVVDLGTVLTAHQDISGKLDTSTYNSDKTVSKTTTSTAKNLVNVSVTSDLIDAVCAQLDAQTTAWT